MKVISIKIALIAATTLFSAFGISKKAPCGPYSALMKPGCEQFIAQGAVAADQNLGNYISMGSVPYDCQLSSCVCTYYLDPIDNTTIRQCEIGTISY